jgi:putative ABC transport system permease protein
MSWLRILLHRLRGMFQKRRLERELEDEIRSHLEMQMDESVRQGMSRDEARYAALRKFGGVEQVKERYRDLHRLRVAETALQDLRYGLRMLHRSPGFTLMAVLTLGLGIGANTAVFSVVNAVLLKPLAYRDADRIVTLSYASDKKTDAPFSMGKQVSVPDFYDWHDQSTTFEAMAYYASRRTSVVAGVEAEYRQAARVSPEFFRVFSLDPAVGRLFTAEEVTPGSGGAAVISYSFWQSHFGGDARALGQTVRMYDHAVIIVGVLPPGFQFPDKTEIWFPVGTITQETSKYRSANNYLAVGRLKPGVSLEQAQTQMLSISARLEQQYPQSNKGRSVSVTRMRDEMVSDVRFTLYLLLAAVALVLLIACANVATLLLAKATSRTREIAVRIAMGASRGRIVWQLATESLVLALLAGTVGLILAVWGLKGLVALAPGELPRLAETGIDGWVLAFTFGISLIASLLFGLAPAIQASQANPNEALKLGARQALAGGTAGKIRSALVVGEIALSVMLLVGAGLLIRSFIALHNVALGFRPENVLVMQATVPAPGPQFARANQFFKDLLADVSALPGVVAAGATMAPPGHIESMTGYWIDHLPKEMNISAPSAVVSVVTPNIFSALGIPLKRGRDFNDGDTRDAPFTAVINEALARSAFPGQDPIGRIIFCGFDSDKPMRIVGVVGDVRQSGPAQEPQSQIYMPYQQHSYNGSTLSVVVRTAADPTSLVETMRRKARERSLEVPVKFTTMEASLYENVAAPRFRTLLLGIFAGLAVCLAMAGVYGAMAYTVSQRSNEIGLRMALGANTSDVLLLVLRQGMAFAASGLALGLIGAVAATRLLTSMLFQVKPGDPMTYIAVVVLLGVVALLACYFPARRASRVDPMVVLRNE